MATGPTHWLTTEFGAALAIVIGITAWIFWRARGAVSSSDRSFTGRGPSTVRAETAAAEG